MKFSGAILDVDGTLLRGSEPIPGLERGLAALDERGIARLYVSNNPTLTPAAYAEKLRAAGIDAAGDDVVTSGSTTVEYLRRGHAGETVYLVGESGLHEQLRAAGFPVVAAGDPAAGGLDAASDPASTDDAAVEDAAVADDATVAEESAVEDVDVAVVSIDREFDYGTMTEALSVLRDGSVPFVGTDPDVTIPGADGDVPGSGAIVGAVATVTERDPDVVLGKPHEVAREMALDRLGCPAGECLVVGDRLDTDIELGARAGATTVLVRSGVTDDARLAGSSTTPDYVVDSFGEIERVLDGSLPRYDPAT